MRKVLVLLLITSLVLAAKVDVRIVTSVPNPQTSQAYVALLTFVQEHPNVLRYIPKPTQWSMGISVTSQPNPKTFRGLLLVFDNQATTGNTTRDKEIAMAYVNNVILPALKNGMRVALIVGPYSNIGQIVLYHLGMLIPLQPTNQSGRIVLVPACLSGIKPLQPMPGLHPIFNNISALPSSCCIVPIVPDVVASASLGVKGKYCVLIRLTKIGDEMIIMSWNGIFRDISTNPNVQQLLINTIKYLAGVLPARYPKLPYTVTSTVTTTITSTTTLTNNITIIMTQIVTSTTTVYSTVTTTYTTTLISTVTTTLTKTVTLTNNVTTTIYQTVTTTITKFSTIISNITKTYTLTTTLVSNITKTLTRTIFNTIVSTATVIKKEANTMILGGAFVGGLIVGIIVIAIIVGRGGEKSKGSVLEEW